MWTDGPADLSLLTSQVLTLKLPGRTCSLQPVCGPQLGLNAKLLYRTSHLRLRASGLPCCAELKIEYSHALSSGALYPENATAENE